MTKPTFGSLPIGADVSDSSAELLSALYTELRQLAAQRLARERPGQTLQATALVHEAWLRLDNNGSHRWNSRAHFFAAAAEAMRRILIDNARRKQRIKNGGGCERLEMETLELAAPLPDDDLLALNEALDQLAELDAQAVALVKLRFFAGLTQADAAEQLGISRSTADRTWRFARAWLYDRIRINDTAGTLKVYSPFYEANRPDRAPVKDEGSAGPPRWRGRRVARPVITTSKTKGSL